MPSMDCVMFWIYEQSVQIVSSINSSQIGAKSGHTTVTFLPVRRFFSSCERVLGPTGVAAPRLNWRNLL